MTKETKHTPGPWGIRQKESIMDNALLIVASNDSGQTFGGHIVTQLCDPATYKGCKNFSPEEQIANARLIAAAPTLLTALQAASDWIDAQLGVPRTEIQAIVQLAIAEAEGVEPTLAA
jgi:hypothetical protein